MRRFKGPALVLLVLIMLSWLSGAFSSLSSTLGLSAEPAEPAARGAGLQGPIPSGYSLVGDAYRVEVSQRSNCVRRVSYVFSQTASTILDNVVSSGGRSKIVKCFREWLRQNIDAVGGVGSLFSLFSFSFCSCC